LSDRPFLTARWLNVLLVSYAVEPDLLTPYVPAGTTLDQHDGITYLSAVAFQFHDTRVLGVPVPLHRHFEELNLRFYVRRQVAVQAVQRAVVFIREMVPRRAIALLARTLYNEPYIARPMRHAVTDPPRNVRYEWRVGDAWHALAAAVTGPAAAPAPETHEAFITEHYWGYTRQRDGSTLEYRVAHPRWQVSPAALIAEPNYRGLCPPELAGALVTPASVLIADGSAVTVSRGTVLAPDALALRPTRPRMPV
jgi:hypothetical protein